MRWSQRPLASNVLIRLQGPDTVCVPDVLVYKQANYAHLAAEQSQPDDVRLARAVQGPGPEPEYAGVHGQHYDCAQQPLHAPLRTASANQPQRKLPMDRSNIRGCLDLLISAVVQLMQMLGSRGGLSLTVRITMEQGCGRVRLTVQVTVGKEDDGAGSGSGH